MALHNECRRVQSSPLLMIFALSILLVIQQVLSNNSMLNRSVRSISFVKPVSKIKQIRDIKLRISRNPPPSVLAEEMVAPKSPTFVFFMGLEGTGHHFMSEFVKNSPYAMRLKELQLTQAQRNLSKSLLALKDLPSALFSAPCSRRDVDVARIEDNVVGFLRNISSSIPDGEDLSVAINCNRGDEMWSYPTGKRTRLLYPNIDLFYHACDRAGVRCEHVYLYRDPYSVIESTTFKRHFNPTVLKAIHLYTSLLNIMYAQMSVHPTRNAGCVGFFDSNSTKQEWRNPVRFLLGWQDLPSDFDDFVQSIYRPPKPLSDERRVALVPSELQVYMESMIQAHNNVLRLCRHQYAQREIAIKK